MVKIVKIMKIVNMMEIVKMVMTHWCGAKFGGEPLAKEENTSCDMGEKTDDEYDD